MSNRPKVGVSVVLRFENLVLLGKRKGSHGAGTWAFPGGHLEYGESVEDCGKRELLEETNIDLKNLVPISNGFTNDIFEDEKNTI